jgi:MFS superfamily sulfate permease-like transporter
MASPAPPPAAAPASPVPPLLASWRDDLPAAVVVFLVALPLCLGLALALGAPLMSGVIAGIIGGLLVGALSGSALIVSGPAITMTAILVEGIASVGSFSRVLPAIVLGGVVQLLLGSLRAGVFAAYIPSSVLRGMLAAIGLTLVLKQIPHALGYDRDFEGDFSFVASTGETTFESIVRAVENLQPGALVVAVLGIIVIAAWPRTPLARIRLVPAPLVAVLLGVLLNELLRIVAPAYAVTGAGLVQLPTAVDGSLWAAIPRPDWTALRDADAWTLALTIGVVASLESLLTMEGTSRLDPRREAAGADRELLAQGAGNILAGLAGGLPVAGAMVRSAVNVNAGARSRLATIAHGALLLVAVLALEPFLDRIPLAALAAILLVTGYRLAEPAVWRHARALGGHPVQRPAGGDGHRAGGGRGGDHVGAPAPPGVHAALPAGDGAHALCAPRPAHLPEQAGDCQGAGRHPSRQPGGAGRTPHHALRRGCPGDHPPLPGHCPRAPDRLPAGGDPRRRALRLPHPLTRPLRLPWKTSAS